MFRKKQLFLCLASYIIISLVSGPVLAQIASMPAPGSMMALSEQSDLAFLRGVRFDAENPLVLEFLFDKGSQAEITVEHKKQLIRYFLSALTVPENKLWVNLSPYEADRVIDDNLVKTEIGETLLSQDYLLKQLSASLTHPDTEIGKAYWEGNREQGIGNSLNKIWIKSGDVSIYDRDNLILVSKAGLKVESENASDNVIVAEIEKDVNGGRNFAELRQMYYSVILAQYFKAKFANTLYSFYFDKEKMGGVDIANPANKDKVFDMYISAFEKGAYDLIRKEQDLTTNRKVKRHYFSGGVKLGQPKFAQVTKEDVSSSIGLDTEFESTQSVLQPQTSSSVVNAVAHDWPTFEYDGKEYGYVELLRLSDALLESDDQKTLMASSEKIKESNQKIEEVIDYLESLDIGDLLRAILVESEKFAPEDNEYAIQEFLIIYHNILYSKIKQDKKLLSLVREDILNIADNQRKGLSQSYVRISLDTIKTSRVAASYMLSLIEGTSSSAVEVADERSVEELETLVESKLAKIAKKSQYNSDIYRYSYERSKDRYQMELEQFKFETESLRRKSSIDPAEAKKRYIKSLKMHLDALAYASSAIDSSEDIDVKITKLEAEIEHRLVDKEDNHKNVYKHIFTRAKETLARDSMENPIAAKERYRRVLDGMFIAISSSSAVGLKDMTKRVRNLYNTVIAKKVTANELLPYILDQDLKEDLEWANDELQKVIDASAYTEKNLQGLIQMYQEIIDIQGPKPKPEPKLKPKSVDEVLIPIPEEERRSLPSNWSEQFAEIVKEMDDFRELYDLFVRLCDMLPEELLKEHTEFYEEYYSSMYGEDNYKIYTNELSRDEALTDYELVIKEDMIPYIYFNRYYSTSRKFKELFFELTASSSIEMDTEKVWMDFFRYFEVMEKQFEDYRIDGISIFNSRYNVVHETKFSLLSLENKLKSLYYFADLLKDMQSKLPYYVFITRRDYRMIVKNIESTEDIIAVRSAASSAISGVEQEDGISLDELFYPETGKALYPRIYFNSGFLSLYQYVKIDSVVRHMYEQGVRLINEIKEQLPLVPNYEEYDYLLQLEYDFKNQLKQETISYDKLRTVVLEIMTGARRLRVTGISEEVLSRWRPLIIAHDYADVEKNLDSYSKTIQTRGFVLEYIMNNQVSPKILADFDFFDEKFQDNYPNNATEKFLIDVARNYKDLIPYELRMEHKSIESDSVIVGKFALKRLRDSEEQLKEVGPEFDYYRTEIELYKTMVKNILSDPSPRLIEKLYADIKGVTNRLYTAINSKYIFDDLLETVNSKLRDLSDLSDVYVLIEEQNERIGELDDIKAKRHYGRLSQLDKFLDETSYQSYALPERINIEVLKKLESHIKKVIKYFDRGGLNKLPQVDTMKVTSLKQEYKAIPKKRKHRMDARDKRSLAIEYGGILQKLTKFKVQTERGVVSSSVNGGVELSDILDGVDVKQVSSAVELPKEIMDNLIGMTFVLGEDKVKTLGEILNFPI